MKAEATFFTLGAYNKYKGSRISVNNSKTNYKPYPIEKKNYVKLI